MTPTAAANRSGNRSPARSDRPARAALVRGLLRWYRRSRRALPWRATRDPYRIWLSEVLLQQTRVESALPYYRRFLAAFPDLDSLARAPEEAVLKQWEGIGYYRRARHMHRAARWLVRERGGEWPRTAGGWRELPGVGEYTAGAVASIAFGERVPAVDGNASRVLTRWFALPRPQAEAAARRELLEIAASLVPARAPAEWNQALMELGARVCLPRRPRCEECPVRARCLAHALGLQSELPRTRPRPPVPRRRLIALALERRGSLLMGRRGSGAMLAGMWELPTVERLPRESTRAALERMLLDCAGCGPRRARALAAEIHAPAARVEHAYSHFTAEIQVYRCPGPAGRAGGKAVPADGEARAGEAPYETMRWVARSEAESLPVHGAARKVLAGISLQPARSAARRAASSSRSP